MTRVIHDNTHNNTSQTQVNERYPANKRAFLSTKLGNRKVECMSGTSGVWKSGKRSGRRHKLVVEIIRNRRSVRVLN